MQNESVADLMWTSSSEFEELSLLNWVKHFDKIGYVYPEQLPATKVFSNIYSIANKQNNIMRILFDLIDAYFFMPLDPTEDDKINDLITKLTRLRLGD